MSYSQQPPNHPRAVTSLVLGVLSVVLCAIVGPIAWWVSRETLVEIDNGAEAYGGRGMAQAGYILGIVGTVLLAVLLTVLLLILVAGFFTTGG